ncbi:MULTISPECIES: hypothetical protein [Fischerella]|uniref:Sigma-70 family RNA polymerase sigma factor n=1 Tax=Fischerella muscicola CCMEE 5323 TaxID=2019572 RepID=A0A2N6K7L5_FISMU|nr:MULTISPECIES: hypothetical protein [Fischerella]MBD2430031.1 hypothetical protein [Fischerella sp. FACHB-380]PLZ93266.1 hypothetical protein CEN44_03640 [Fischerella muscicola CCMEE 5323]
MDQQLEQLVAEAQQYAPQTEERQLVLTQLVDQIMRSRKICRQFRNQPLFGVYEQIYQLVRQQLLFDIQNQLNQYNPKQTNIRAWTCNLCHQAFRNILTDVQLKNLALEAQRHPPHTELRQYALGELIEAIRLSGRLCHPHKENFSSPQFYQLLYDEAVNITLTYVCQKIDIYDPERGDKKFMNWVNFRLDKVLIQSSQEFRKDNIYSLPCLSDLETFVQPEETPLMYENLRDFLEKDYEHIFKNTHIRNRPDANFATIALARLSGKNWQDISRELGISIPTLSSFFQRSCEKFRNHFRQYI